MRQEIKTSQEAADAAKRSLEGSLEGFCEMRLEFLAELLPVAGSTRHDADLRKLLCDSLGAYKTMIESDAEAIQAIHDGIARADARRAALTGRG